MGTDTPISALSDKSKLLYTYFKQNFAQVTNPPIDPIREELVMSLVSFIGPRPNIFDLEGNSKRKRLEVRQPILTNGDLEKIRSIGRSFRGFTSTRRRSTSPIRPSKGAAGMGPALDASVRPRRAGGEARRLQHHHPVRPHVGPGPHSDAGAAGYGGRASSPDPQGSAHVGRPRGRTGEPREVHHFACLAGYGAEAINPYLAFETLAAMRRRHSPRRSTTRNRQALHQGHRQGPDEGDVEDGHLDLSVLLRRADFRRDRPEGFRRRISPAPRPSIEGVGLDEVARETGAPSCAKLSATRRSLRALDVGGEYAFRMRGEAHALDRRRRCRCCSTPCAAIQSGEVPRLARIAERAGRKLLTIRGLFRIKSAEEDGRKPVAVRKSNRQGHRQALRHRRDELRLDLARGAHHARHRDEPHRRQVEHRRRRRRSRPLQADARTATRCARRSSRSRPAASA
jgi:glutamate synthase (NADPH/NADH) large chain